MKLSHSSLSRYQQCPTSFKLHYIDRLGSVYKSGALFFGSAIDLALNHLLSNRDDIEGAKQVFAENWKTQDGENLMRNTNITYAASDFDSDLLSKSDWAALYAQSENPFNDFNRIKKEKAEKGWGNLESSDRAFYNEMNWRSLAHKGEYMVEAYAKDILPQIKKVIAIQVPINLDNGSGDVVVGFADLVAELQDGSIAVLDNKTSSMEYEDDSVLKSPQLALYKLALNNETENPKSKWKHRIDKAGFLVLRKGLKKDITKICKKCSFEAEKGDTHKTCHNEDEGKRCGGAWNRSVKFSVETQIIVDPISERFQDMVLDNVNDINACIKTEIYPKNFQSCVQNWGPCEYFSICHHGNYKDIVKLKDRK